MVWDLPADDPVSFTPAYLPTYLNYVLLILYADELPYLITGDTGEGATSRSGREAQDRKENRHPALGQSPRFAAAVAAGRRPCCCVCDRACRVEFGFGRDGDGGRRAPPRPSWTEWQG